MAACPEGGWGLGVARVPVEMKGREKGRVTLSCYPSSPQLSPYPVILSLENHCGLEQQAAMAHHLRTILGDMLVTQALDSPNPEELPSPEVRLPDPSPGWGGVCLQSNIHPCSCHFPGSGPLTSLRLNLPLLLPSSCISTLWARHSPALHS